MDHKYVGKGTCANWYPGHRQFGCNYDQERIATGWGYLETGTPQQCNFQKEYHEGPLHVPEYNLKGVNG